ncbi:MULTISPECIES: type IV conjugative transfer system coupling protein TraD [Alloalcanivorax]|uniref:type IV conjugative transfer system coupling protein TraD n=1 Tax=Alloalcanivorax TaxID=3020832 RepID=UPI0004B4003F|nr:MULTISPECIES: type IV conjugative transfer system coupling protein TraD [Alloalcanivorax]ARB45739.1 conjugal transfer protein TraG [Alloalcanivorax xenomutans]GGJ84001.1 conjugative coupling factor TraD, PFGI-1 class [Alloalcanivorax dieselolei]CUR46908.1 Type IV secretory pathway, VirD4 components [Alloalcanivorax xenomutans]
MSQDHPIESLLRPAVEAYTAGTCLGCAVLCLWAPWSIALTPSIGYGTAAAFLLFAGIRGRQAWRIWRYRRNMKRLPRFSLTSRQIPVSQRQLWLGKGFRWEAIHTRRLYEAQLPETQSYLQPSLPYQLARAWENRLDRYAWGAPVIQLLSADTPLNPVRPLPPVGGLPALHAVEPTERDVYLPLGERVGHTLVEGTTRVGKTRLAEILITQDIHRGDVVICFDPKGDADLMMRMYIEAHRADRGDAFHIFHLGYPALSARYNAVGRFGRISEVATRISGQLSGEGNSAAFREFAWRFVNIVARARHALGQRPTYEQILADVINIDDIMIEYCVAVLPQYDQTAWDQIREIEGKLKPNAIPRNMQGRHPRVVAIELYLQGNPVADTVLQGLRSAVRYDKTYFDKIVASLLPLLEKLTTGQTAELLSPDYTDLEDKRPIFDWRQVIRQRGIVYVGLDAMSDFEVAQAVGNSMFADLVSMAGHIYKHGIDDGLPDIGRRAGKLPINLHCDEFNELMGEEFIPLINKGGGAGIQVTAYTQTLSDIEARIGNAAKARQVVGNFNNVIMLRVREDRTAELLTRQLRKVSINQRMLMSMTSDNSNVDTDQDFSSSGGDRVSTVQVPMIEPADVVSLPKGQAFALLEGGQLWKIRMPLPLPDTGTEIPTGVTDLASRMREKYHTGDHWWETVMPAPIQITPPTGDVGVQATSASSTAGLAPQKTNWEGDFEVASGYSDSLGEVDDGVDED